MAIRLAVLVTHPIQYFAPLFRILARSDLSAFHVFYGWEGAIHGTLDRGFGQVIQWDIPLLDGYEYTFIPNESHDPGTHHYFGISSKQTVGVIRRWRPDALMVFGWNYRSHLAALRAFHGHIPVFFPR